MAEKRSFESRLQRLEEIVSALEKGDAPLADSLALFEEGTKLVGECTRELDRAEQKVVKLMKGPDGAPVELPPKEYELLLLLLRNRGRALYRDYILETVWGLDAELDTARTVDTHIRRLRRKLGWDSQIETVWRVGYCLQPEEPKQEVPRC